MARGLRGPGRPAVPFAPRQKGPKTRPNQWFGTPYTTGVIYFAPEAQSGLV